jgi:transcriptional regulator NrdR family protein
MITQVIKKDGKKEPFDVEKIKQNIIAASKEAGLEEAKQKEIAETVSDKVLKTFQEQAEVTHTEIRDLILKELDISAPVVAETWRKYETNK